MTLKTAKLVVLRAYIRGTSCNMRIIFFGTSEFALPPLKALLKDAEMKLVAVVTETDKPAGRKMELKKSPVKLFTESKRLKLFQPEKFDKKTAEKISELRPDIAVLVAYGKIIPEEILKIPKKGFVNIHPSLLPRHRGASPAQTAILSGDKKTGVTIFVLDEKIDHGPILAQKPYEMKGNETTPELTKKLSVLGTEILIPTIKKYINNELRPQKQNENQATLTKQFSREDGKIDWKKPAEEIERMVRAFYPWPGAWAEIPKIGRVKITKASVALATDAFVAKAPKNSKSGVFFELNKKPAVVCGKDALIIDKLIPEGKKEMSGEEFLRGHRQMFEKM